MFVETTPGGRLKAKLRKMDRSLPFTDKCKYVEEAGTTVLQMLFKVDPFEKPCGRQDCLICQGKPGKCTQKSVIYQYDSMICQDEGNSSSYIGETARSDYERAKEHSRLIVAKDMESPMIENNHDHHQDQPVQVRMKVVRIVKRVFD